MIQQNRKFNLKSNLLDSKISVYLLLNRNFDIKNYEKEMLAIQIKQDELEKMKKSLLAICDGAKNRLINVFNFDKGDDLEISIIKTFLNCNFIFKY